MTGPAQHTPRHRVLLIGHPDAQRLVAALTAAGFETQAVPLDDAYTAVGRFQPTVSLLLIQSLDMHPPEFRVLAHLTEEGYGGVIAILQHDSEPARVECLDRGADDVVSGLVSMRELAAHLRAVARRAARQSGEGLSSGQLSLDPAHRCIVGPRGEYTPLSEAEYVALETLIDADGAAVSRDWLGRVALKRPLHPDDRSVDQLVLKLRRKLTASGAPERTILSARRQGYVIPDPSRFRTTALPSSERPPAADFLEADLFAKSG
jgi:two-component system, OmpR family, response regulator